MRFVTSAEEMAQIADPDGWYARMRSRRTDMIERIGLQVRAAVEEDGAVYLQAELTVRMGLRQSPTSFPPADAPRAEVLPWSTARNPFWARNVQLPPNRAATPARFLPRVRRLIDAA